MIIKVEMELSYFVLFENTTPDFSWRQ